MLFVRKPEEPDPAAVHPQKMRRRVPRDQREAEFRAYQSKRRRLGRDGRLL
jgi:hypothetical protein